MILQQKMFFSLFATVELNHNALKAKHFINNKLSTKLSTHSSNVVFNLLHHKSIKR